MNRSVLLAFCCILHTVFGGHVSFQGYSLWSVTPLARTAADKLHALENTDGFDFWSSISTLNRSASVIVAPEQQSMFKKLIRDDNIQSDLIINDLERVLEKDRQSQRNGQLKLLRHGFAQNDTIALDHYWNYEEIDRYIEFLLKNHAETVEAERIGYSFEGRELRALKISKHGEVDGSRPIIFIDAGTHAREWVSHMSAVYLLHKLVEHRDRNELLQHVDWIIVPIVNPDGFIYSHTTNRMWRTNRRSYWNCTGVDINRNYGFKWEASKKCSPSFSGTYPFSEPESRAIRKVLLKYQGKIKLYTSLHAFGPIVLYPWGYEKKLISNWKEHAILGHQFAKAAANVAQNAYAVGNSAELMYPASGCSDDYAASIGVELSFTVELFGEKKSGFHPPAAKLRSIVEETFAGLAEFGKHAANKWGRS